MRTIPRLIQLSPGGFLNLNVAEHRLSWTASRSDHWWLLPCCQKPGDRRSTTESPGDSHRSGRFIWQHLEYFAWTFGFKHGPSQMGPMFSDTRSEVISGGSMFGAVGYLQCNPEQRVVLHNNWWWNVDSPLGSRHQTRVDAVEARQLPPLRKFRTQCRLESYGHYFLGLQRRPAAGLSTTEDNNDWTILWWSAGKSASGSEREAEGNADPRSAVAAR